MDEDRLEKELRSAFRPVKADPELRERLKADLLADKENDRRTATTRRLGQPWVPWMAAAAVIFMAMSVSVWGDDLWGVFTGDGPAGAGITQLEGTRDRGDADEAAPDVPRHEIEYGEIVIAASQSAAADGAGYGVELRILWGDLWPQEANLPHQRVHDIPPVRHASMPEVTAATAARMADRKFASVGETRAVDGPPAGGFAVDVTGGQFFLFDDHTAAFQGEGSGTVRQLGEFTGSLSAAWSPAGEDDETYVNLAQTWVSDRRIATITEENEVWVHHESSETVVRFGMAGNQVPVASASPAIYIRVGAENGSLTVSGARWLWPGWGHGHTPWWLDRDTVTRMAATGLGYLRVDSGDDQWGEPIFTVERMELAYAYTIKVEGGAVLLPVYRLYGDIGSGDDATAAAELWLPAVSY